jgi:hypothetical protein
VHRKDGFVDPYSFIEGLRAAGLYQNPERLPQDEFGLMNDASMFVDGYFNEMLAPLEEQWNQEEIEKLTKRMLKGDIRSSEFTDLVNKRVGYMNGRPGGQADEPITPQWPERLRKAAFYGLAGKIVRKLAPQTEASPVGILAHMLQAFGNAVDCKAYFRVGSIRHYAKFNVVLVGTTGHGRKGTAMAEAKSVMSLVDPDWVSDCFKGGLSSGEGLIHAVRDPIYKEKAIKLKGKPTGEFETELVDEGISDKRIFIFAPEFAAVLRVMASDGNTLSETVRQLFDDTDLRIMNKNSPERASRVHGAIAGHITRNELRKELEETDAANGFGNRYMWLCVKRARLLPEGGLEVNLGTLTTDLKNAIAFGKKAGEIKRDTTATELWKLEYPKLTAGRTGMYGAIVGRTEVFCLRIAMIYALLDQSVLITEDHLKAALELWRYADQSALFIFGDRIGDRDADAILGALREAGMDGLTRTEISQLFARSRSSASIDRALSVLLEAGLASRGKGRNGRETG